MGWVLLLLGGVLGSFSMLILEFAVCRSGRWPASQRDSRPGVLPLVALPEPGGPFLLILLVPGSCRTCMAACTVFLVSIENTIHYHVTSKFYILEYNKC